MGKFSSAKMNGAQDVKFKNVYNSLVDLLETGYVVESMIGGHRIRVTIDTENGILITSDGVKLFGLDTLSGKIMVLGTASEDYVAQFEGIISALDAAAVKLGVTYAGAAMSALSGFTNSAILGGKEVVINMSAAGGGLTISVDGVQTGGICLVGGVPALIAGVLSNSPNPNVWAEIGEKVIDGNALKGLLMYRLDSLGAKYAASGWTLDDDGKGFAIGDATWERFFAHGTEGGYKDANGIARVNANESGLFVKESTGAPRVTLDGINTIIHQANGAPVLNQDSFGTSIYDCNVTQRIILTTDESTLADATGVGKFVSNTLNTKAVFDENNYFFIESGHAKLVVGGAVVASWP